MKKTKFFRLALLTLSMLILLMSCNDVDKPVDTETEAPSDTVASTESTSDTQDDGYQSADRTDVINSFKFKNRWKTGISVSADDGETINLREIEIDIDGDGTPIEIYQISDVHFNAVNSDEDSVIQSSYREWGNFNAGNSSLEAFKRCVRYAAKADRIMVTGDLANFYSKANFDLVEKYIFNAKTNITSELEAKIIASCGNHDATFPNARSDTARFERNYDALAGLYTKYGQNISYYSDVIDNRVMVVQIDNASHYDVSSERFTEAQRAALASDIATAKRDGYVMLIFCHVPLPTNNSQDGFYCNYDEASYKSAGASKSVYELIANNADVIKGVFAGHNHGDAYGEIVAKTSAGKPAFVPQYVLNTLVGSTGEMTKIVLK